MAALGVVPAFRVAMDTSSLLIAFGPLLTFKAPAPKLIISDEFNEKKEEEEEEEESHEYFLGTTSENAPLDNYYQSARFHACSRECTIRLKFRAMSL